jgi:hypothetical protein
MDARTTQSDSLAFNVPAAIASWPQAVDTGCDADCIPSVEIPANEFAGWNGTKSACADSPLSPRRRTSCRSSCGFNRRFSTRRFCHPATTDGHPFLSALCLALSLCILSTALPARAQTTAEPRVTLRLREATAAELAAALTAALGATVSVEGATPRRVSLELEDAAGAQALDCAAAALGGRWQIVYRVEPADGAGGAAGRGVTTGRTVTLRLEGVAAGAALAAVARAAGARLELSVPPAGSVTLEAADLPVEAALDRVTGQIGARWRASYHLLPGPSPPPEPAASSQAPAAPPQTPVALPVPLTPPAGSPPVRGSGAARAPETAALRQMLTGELARLFQTNPGARSPAVRRYTARLERLLQGLSPAEQARRIEPLRPLIRSGLRALHGLTPDQQSDFRPVIEVFRRWIR